MKARNYTAQEMRELAEMIDHGGAFVLTDPSVLEANVAMLRQAADDLERVEQEKKYEYATKWDDGKIDGISPYKDEVTDSISFVEYISSISADDKTGCKLVRREVGEWEAVEE